MSNKQEKVVFILMALGAMVFVISFLIASSNYRLAADDFHYLIKTQELGVWNSTLYYYDNWNPRWSASLIRSAVLNTHSSPIGIFWFQLITLLFSVVAVRSFVHAVVKSCAFPITKGNQWIMAFYLVGGLFYSSFSKDDTWFWLSSTPSYLIGSFAALLGGSFLFKRMNKAMKYMAVFVLFLYVGGSSETVALATLATLFYVGFISHRKNLLIDIDRKALHLATIACLISFGIALSSQGLLIRYEHLPQYDVTDVVLVGFRNYFKFILWEIPLVIPIILLIVAPFAFFGRKQLQFQLISIKEVVWSNRKLWAIADIIIALLAFALAFAMGEMGPARSWLPLTFLVLIAAIIIAYQLGTWVYIRTKGQLFKLVVSCQVILLGFQLFTGIQQAIITREYAHAVDARMDFLQHIQPAESCLIDLEPLPDPGWLFSSEISNDTTHFSNQHLRSYFGGQCNFRVSQNVSSPTE